MTWHLYTLVQTHTRHRSMGNQRCEQYWHLYRLVIMGCLHVDSDVTWHYCPLLTAPHCSVMSVKNAPQQPRNHHYRKQCGRPMARVKARRFLLKKPIAFQHLLTWLQPPPAWVILSHFFHGDTSFSRIDCKPHCQRRWSCTADSTLASNVPRCSPTVLLVSFFSELDQESTSVSPILYLYRLDLCCIFLL